jgi:hypothetical protein
MQIAQYRRNCCYISASYLSGHNSTTISHDQNKVLGPKRMHVALCRGTVRNENSMPSCNPSVTWLRISQTRAGTLGTRRGFLCGLEKEYSDKLADVYEGKSS